MDELKFQQFVSDVEDKNHAEHGRIREGLENQVMLEVMILTFYFI